MLGTEGGGPDERRWTRAGLPGWLRDGVPEAFDVERRGRVGDDLQAGLEPGRPAHRDRVQAELDDLGNRTRGEQRHRKALRHRFA